MSSSDSDCGSTSASVVVDYSGDSIQMTAAQPGWPGLTQVGVPRELWRLVTPDLIELYPDLEHMVEMIGDEYGMDQCDFDADWQSVYNLTAFLGETATDEESVDIVAAWKRQPNEHRRESWLRNGGHPRVAVAQLLGPFGHQTIPFRRTVKPWLRDLAAITSLRDLRLECPSANTRWIGAETPLGVTCVSDLDIGTDVFVLDPIFSTCPVSFSRHYRDAGSTWESLNGLRKFVAGLAEHFRGAGYDVRAIESDVEAWIKSVCH